MNNRAQEMPVILKCHCHLIFSLLIKTGMANLMYLISHLPLYLTPFGRALMQLHITYPGRP